MKPLLIAVFALLPLTLRAEPFNDAPVLIQVGERCQAYLHPDEPGTVIQVKRVNRRRGCALTIITADISLLLPVEINFWGAYLHGTKEAQLIYTHPTYSSFKHKVRLTPRALRKFFATTETVLPMEQQQDFEEVRAELSRCESDADCGQLVDFNGCNVAINNEADPAPLLALKDSVQIMCVECLLAAPICHNSQCAQLCDAG